MGKKKKDAMDIEDEAIEKLEGKISEDLRRKIDPEVFSTVETVFDERTLQILNKFFQQGLIDGIEGAISTGKEANVYYCPGNPPLACKIYRINSPAFKKMKIYVEGDHRFQSYRKSRVGFIQAWAKKEFKNLKKMKEVGIPVPEPIEVERNVLLMEFLGDGEYALPKLVEAKVDSYARLYKDVMKAVQIMYREAKLVHGDLSPFNILFREDNQQFYIIDVSQSVLNSHPHAELFLIRDVLNLNQFFADNGIEIIEEAKLLHWITGYRIDEGKILMAKNFDIE
ncbi:MAG: serine protein kinase RIO [Methanobacteriota archaeon]|nr:MAG: serine protein kinase RIO [Euryarchaeota archaeon]